MSQTTSASIAFAPDPKTTLTVAKLRELLSKVPEEMADKPVYIWFTAAYPDLEGDRGAICKVDVLENFECVDICVDNGN